MGGHGPRRSGLQLRRLSFFSEGGLRYFLPAYLIADIEDSLDSADVVFHLAGAFRDAVVGVPVRGRVFEKRIGKSTPVNPRRYGAITLEDYARFRLAVFTREEAVAIVAYLEYQRGLPGSLDVDAIEAALDSFWHGRVDEAPRADALAEYVRSEDEFIREVSAGLDRPDND